MQNNWILSGQARTSGAHRTELERAVDGTFELGDCGLEHSKESGLELYTQIQRRKRLKTCYSRQTVGYHRVLHPKIHLKSLGLVYQTACCLSAYCKEC